MCLHETTAYEVRGMEGLSDGVTRERIEGGGESTSLILLMLTIRLL